MNVIELTKELITLKSITPEDAGCQARIAELLKEAGFNTEQITIGNVENLWAVHGNEGPLFCFLGHTDVVPTGPVEDWKYPPFVPTEENGVLYGRGAADMKGCVAAFVLAMCRFAKENPAHRGRLALLLTSDEEGPAIYGTQAVVRKFDERGIKIDYCLVAEPSSEEELGDVVKVGRRGSLGCRLSVIGIQGHVAYPQLALNPIHVAAPAIAELCAEKWDEGNEFFPPTSFQISNVHGGTGADNVIPGRLDLVFNFRFSTASTPENLKDRTEAILKKHGLEYEIVWNLSGRPFFTAEGKLVDAVVSAIETELGSKPRLSTAGGTSDGRFIAPGGAEVVEFGVINRTIHKVDEQVKVADLEKLEQIYLRIIESALA
jgi:succinyl-diaminopimelate desuccinylase